MELFILISGWCAAFLLFLYIILIKRLHGMISNSPDGTFIINENDPEKDVYTIEINIPFGVLHRRKFIYFNIRRI